MRLVGMNQNNTGQPRNDPLQRYVKPRGTADSGDNSLFYIHIFKMILIKPLVLSRETECSNLVG